MAYRFSTLALALVAAAPALAQSVADEKGPTTVDAETIEGIGDLEVTARGGAEQLEFLGKDRYRLKNASFTSCPGGFSRTDRIVPRTSSK